jgi:hypothetical protein
MEGLIVLNPEHGSVVAHPAVKTLTALSRAKVSQVLLDLITSITGALFAFPLLTFMMLAFIAFPLGIDATDQAEGDDCQEPAPP